MVTNCQGTKWGKLHHRRLENDKLLALKTSHCDLEDLMSVNSGLAGISCRLPNAKLEPFSFAPYNAIVTLHSEASLKGWDGTLHTEKKWSK